MSRILVTGVDGFTGRYLAPALAAEGHEVHGLLQRAWPAGKPLPDGVHAVHTCELLDPQGLMRMGRAARIGFVQFPLRLDALGRHTGGFVFQRRRSLSRRRSAFVMFGSHGVTLPRPASPAKP